MSREFKQVTAEHPCPACGKPDWCAWTRDGMLKCERVYVTPVGMRLVSRKDGGGVFAFCPSEVLRPRRPKGGTQVSDVGTVQASERAVTPVDIEAANRAFQQRVTDVQVQSLAAELGVAASALRDIGIGWATRTNLRSLGAGGKGWEGTPDGAYTFPEVDGSGTVVGFSFRTADHKHGAPSKSCGTRRGIVLPRSVQESTEREVLVVEGASDVAACLSMGLMAVGRPSNAAGADELAGLLAHRSILVIGENDRKDDGLWPGREGAQKVAHALTKRLKRQITWALPPEGCKDARAYLATALQDSNVQKDLEAFGKEFKISLVHDQADSHGKDQGPVDGTNAEMMVHDALRQNRAAADEHRKAFLAPGSGPNIALMLDSPEARRYLVREFRRSYNHVPNSAAVTDAVTALQAEAMDAEPERLALRVVGTTQRSIVDLGRTDGKSVVIERGAWQVVDRSPIIFRRTPLIGCQSIPVTVGSLTDLREVLNVTDAQWPLVVAWLVSAFITDISHPILLLGAEQGSGKTTAARMLLRLIDPSPAELRSVPKSAQDWAVAASGSYAFAIDNISVIPDWWSDALCKAVTGDGWVGRTLYTNSDISVLSFRRVIAMTSIDPGVLKGDLGDRLLLIDLAPISETSRRSEAEIEALFEKARPGILGALFTMVARVFDVLPRITLGSLPRMADFARVLAAVDAVLGTQGLDEYLGQRARIAGEIVEEDGVGEAMVHRFRSGDEWHGTASQLLRELVPRGDSRDWPRSPTGLGRRLRRIAPALRTVGIQIEFPRLNDKRRMHTVVVHETNALNAQTPVDAENNEANRDLTTGVCTGIAEAVVPNAQPNAHAPAA